MSHRPPTREPYIEAGIVGTAVWIGAPASHYDCCHSELTNRETHVLRFSIAEAEAVIKMLRVTSKTKVKEMKSLLYALGLGILCALDCRIIIGPEIPYTETPEVKARHESEVLRWQKNQQCTHSRRIVECGYGDGGPSWWECDDCDKRWERWKDLPEWRKNQ